MIINIPINFDETAFEGKISQDVQDKVVVAITERVEDALAKRAAGYYYGDKDRKVIDGVRLITEEAVAKVIDKYEDHIIEIAGKELGARLAKTKKGKEILERCENEN